jgi:sulfotransferase family protein
VIVFCTTCKNRTQHLEKTLPQNLADNGDYPDCKFVILGYDSSDHLLPYLQEKHQDAIDSGRLVVYNYRDSTPFKVAHAKNMAHRLGILEGADILVNLDADNFTGPGFARYIADQFEIRWGACEPSGKGLDAFGERDIFLWARMITEGPDRLPRGINGRLVVPRKAFLLAGGYDERFAVWSPDDKDFNLRVRRLGYQAREIDRRFLDCVRHNDKMRFKHTSTREGYADIREESVASSDVTIVNYGKIGCGTVFRNFSPELIELRPLPTRIFGIGMHKTATTSLHAALKILGIDSAHWKSAHWAKAIWKEMNASGRSPTLERHYALSDLPIPVLYRQVDRAYPGSKFILTIRDEKRWIESVRKHWSEQSNPFRASWDSDPFSHRVHKIVYGQSEFDADIFLARYRRHNAEVKEYFKDRPGDLLVMDMDSKMDLWEGLCTFLDCPVPLVPYPRVFVTR